MTTETPTPQPVMLTVDQADLIKLVHFATVLKEHEMEARFCSQLKLQRQTNLSVACYEEVMEKVIPLEDKLGVQGVLSLVYKARKAQEAKAAEEQPQTNAEGTKE